MFLSELIVALLVALTFTVVFTWGFRRTGPWSSVFLFLILVFLASWAGGLWAAPVGPVFMGVFWMPYVVLGFLVALLLGASVPPAPRGGTPETISEVKQQERTRKRAADAMLWLLLVAFAVVIAVAYMIRQPGIGEGG